MNGTAENKKALRAFFKEKRRLLDKDKKAELDRDVCCSVLSLNEFKCADILLAFYPSFNEPDILPIIKEALRCGKRVAFPLCNKETHTMRFFFVDSLDELCAGSYSIPEPPMENDEYTDGENALCLVPALAFDSEGYRLGYGAGYYDRFLASFGGASVGIAYSDFVCDSLPRGEFDLKSSILITEKGRVFIND